MRKISAQRKARLAFSGGRFILKGSTPVRQPSPSFLAILLFLAGGLYVGRSIFPKVDPTEYPDERTDALEHLDFAIEEIRVMKMQPSLERALRSRDLLKA